MNLPGHTELFSNTVYTYTYIECLDNVLIQEGYAKRSHYMYMKLPLCLGEQSDR